MKRLARHIAKKETIEDFFQGFGFFAATAALVQLCGPVIRQRDGLLGKFGFIGIIYGLLFLSGFYLAAHVIRPLIRIYSPDFTLADVDRRHIVKKSFRPAALLFALLLLGALYLGWELVEIALLSISKPAAP
jgi:hypothetical protein